MITDYQILLIIITIIGFIISTAFYIYFVYLPAARIEDQFDAINTAGTGLINKVNDGIPKIENNVVETLTSICNTINNIICGYNSSIIAKCNNPILSECSLSKKALPDYCNDFIKFTCDGCPATGLNKIF